MVDSVFNASELRCVRGEPFSTSSSLRRNSSRSIYDLMRKKTGKRGDLLIVNSWDMELACCEAGLEEEKIDNKVNMEASLKAPKMMHDIFNMLCIKVKNEQSTVKQIQVVGFIFSRFKICMLTMDCPNGYVCRLRSTNTLQFTGEEVALGEEFSKVYQLVYMARNMCLRGIFRGKGGVPDRTCCLSTNELIKNFNKKRDVGYVR